MVILSRNGFAVLFFTDLRQMVMVPKSSIIYEAAQWWRKDWPGGSRSAPRGSVTLPFLACVQFVKRREAGCVEQAIVLRCFPGLIAESLASACLKEGG